MVLRQKVVAGPIRDENVLPLGSISKETLAKENCITGISIVHSIYNSK